MEKADMERQKEKGKPSYVGIVVKKDIRNGCALSTKARAKAKVNNLEKETPREHIQ